MTNYNIERLITDSEAIKIVQAQENLRSDATQDDGSSTLAAQDADNTWVYRDFNV